MLIRAFTGPREFGELSIFRMGARSIMVTERDEHLVR